ncbi:MAG TPA: hypothetical protein PKO15_11245 [Fibrobacteria bacterium]|nr:hypothetical protein [Fibrobacteria bacterium]HOX51734.1 hypothetical protein [Fibrobacteria bacterium]
MVLGALALVGAFCLPVWVRLHAVFRDGTFKVSILPWGVPMGGGRLLGWLSRKVESLFFRFLDSKMESPPSPSPEKSSPSKGRKKRLPWRWIVWLAGRGFLLIGLLTRRLSFRVAGWDPALMGFCQGALSGGVAALGIRKVRWESDFGPSPPHAECTWDLGTSLLGLVLWGGRNAFRMPFRRRSESEPSGPAFSSFA